MPKLKRLYGCAGLLLAFAPAVSIAQSIASDASLYHLHVSDVVQVSFHLTPELDTSVTIQPDGFVTIPSIGEVRLSSLTLNGAASAITTKSAERLNAPEVTVTLKEFERPHFFVGGEVGRPGKYTLDGPLTAIQAVQLAGGLKNDTGSATHVLLLRPVGGDVAETRMIDLKHAGQKEDSSAGLGIRSGDTLIVSENNFTKIARYVKVVNPGVYVPLYK